MAAKYPTPISSAGLIAWPEDGNSASVWGAKAKMQLDFARTAQAGTVWTGIWMDGSSETPFAGMKECCFEG